MLMKQTTQNSQLVDAHGRWIHKLRVQLIDACNYRCVYCMPEYVIFRPSSELLSSKEIIDICDTLIGLGIDEIRLTGGEPTLRRDLIQIARGVSGLPVKKLGLTTNGLKLKEKLSALKSTRCQHINISLDSLNPQKYERITRRNNLDEVLSSIFIAKDMGFSVKINVVVMRGFNHDEILDYIAFSAKHNIEVRFLELMKIGCAVRNFDETFVSAQEMIDQINEPLEKQKMKRDSTSFNFKTLSGAHIGFIASESRPFCGGCSRLRLTADGKLRACLMSEKGADLRGKDKKEYRSIVESVMKMKPTGRIDKISQPMYQIGG